MGEQHMPFRYRYAVVETAPSGPVAPDRVSAGQVPMMFLAPGTAARNRTRDR